MSNKENACECLENKLMTDPTLTPQALPLTTDFHHWAPKSQPLILKILIIAQNPITELFDTNQETPQTRPTRPTPALKPKTIVTNSTDKPSITDLTELLIKTNQNHHRHLPEISAKKLPTQATHTHTHTKKPSARHFRFQSDL